MVKGWDRMSDDMSKPADAARDASFDTVLKAERESEDALRASRIEANRIRQAATTEERRIAERTDKRLQKLHAANQRRISEARLTLAQAFEEEQGTLSADPDQGEVATAAVRLARKLAGLDPT